MFVFRWLRATVKAALSLLVLLPLMALLLSILLDRGPSGETRVSPHFFPLALWLYDEFAWTCALNSVIFALVVTAASLFLGVAVAWAGAAAVLGTEPAVPRCRFARRGLAGIPCPRPCRVTGRSWSVAVAAGNGGRSWSACEPRVVVGFTVMGHVGVDDAAGRSGGRFAGSAAVGGAAGAVLGRCGAACGRAQAGGMAAAALAAGSSRGSACGSLGVCRQLG